MDEVVVDAQADSKRPYKMYAVLVSTAASTILTTAVALPMWAVVSLTVLVNCAAVYLVPNPIKVTKSRTVVTDRRTTGYDSPTLWDS